MDIKEWFEVKFKEHENRIVQLKQENSILRTRLDHVEEKVDSLNTAFMKVWKVKW